MKCFKKSFLVVLCCFFSLLFSISSSTPTHAINSINKIGWFNSHYSSAGQEFDISYNPGGSNPRVVDNAKNGLPVYVSRQVIWFSLPTSGIVGKRSLKFDFNLTYWANPNSVFWNCINDHHPALDISLNDAPGKGVVSNFSCNRYLENNNSVIKLTGSVFFSPDGGFVKDPYFRLFIGSYDSTSWNNSFLVHNGLSSVVPNLKLNYFDISNIELYSDPNTQYLNNLVVQNQTIINQNSQLNNSINNQTQQQNQNFQQNKQEEKDREKKGNDQSNKLGNLFSFTAFNPFSGLFGLFTGGGCKPIPTIGKMLNKPDATYCPWFPDNVRSILTPVLGISSMMLIFGFFIRWLNSDDFNGIGRNRV